MSHRCDQDGHGVHPVSGLKLFPVNPAIKYTLARLGLFVVALLVLLPIPALDILLKLMIAVLVSAVASWFLLRRMRDQVAGRIEESMLRRRDEREKLRAALAGEDKAEPDGKA